MWKTILIENLHCTCFQWHPTTVYSYDDSYKQALHCAKEARDLADQHKLPFTRPADYFAEMVKSDAHMERVRHIPLCMHVEAGVHLDVVVGRPAKRGLAGRTRGWPPGHWPVAILLHLPYFMPYHVSICSCIKIFNKTCGTH